MHRRLLLSCWLLFLMPGCDWPLFTAIQRVERVHGPSPPVIYEAYAPSLARPGEPLKIYLRAGDPDGDMNGIVATVEQFGTGAHASRAIPVPPANRKALNGFLAVTVQASAEPVQLRAGVKIQDMANHFSNEVFFPFVVQPQPPPPPPNLNLFQEENLGVVSFDVQAMPHPKKPGLWARLAAWWGKTF